MTPRATYRLQLTPERGLAAAADLAPYLAALGVSHCYVSPILKTRPGSTHGYDVIDHEAVNPELGGPEQLERLCAALAEQGLGLIVDIVPNHVGIMGSDGGWWLDVLENGQASPFADYFDIDWHPVKRELQNKVLVPVLGDHYGHVLLGGELELRLDAQSGELSVWYHQHRFPLDPATYPMVLARAAATLRGEQRPEAPELIELESILRSLAALPPATTTAREEREVRRREQTAAKRRLVALGESRVFAQAAAGAVASFRGTPGERASFEPLHRLLELQPYRLAFWRVASDEINYRRFFDVNDLAALRTQNQEVLEVTHRKLLEWVRDGKVQGLRVDHPDGLYDPRGYLTWLRGKLAAVGRPGCYVVVEKILAAHEFLPEDWPVQGTTGYDFSFVANELLVHAPSQRAFRRAYRDFTGRRDDYDELLYLCKREILTYHLSSELTVLANLLDRIAEARIETRDFTLNALRAGLLELVASFPVYRTYVGGGRPSEQDRRHIEWAAAQAARRYGGRDEGVIDFVRRLLLKELPTEHDDEYRAMIDRFTSKFEQLTAPVTAKAMEDTCFYRYTPLLSLNEVGGDPRRFGITPAGFHHLSQMRAQHWPDSMLGTSTHDSKRSEDVRARIDVLTEMPEEWRARLAKWRRFNQSKRRRLDDRGVPSRHDEYLLYQTVVGSWPSPADDDALGAYRERIEQYMLKAAREAKLATSWSNPNEAYEERLLAFVTDVLSRDHPNQFLDDVEELVGAITVPGYLSSLSQTLLKLASPGVPDIYQGTELWELTLVDPDNRRPVDHALRRRMLAELEARAAEPDGVDGLVDELWRTLPDGRAKLYLTWRTLALRRRHAELFRRGAYVPLATHGEAAEHVCTFARRHEGEIAVVAVGRWFTRLPDWPPSARGEPPRWGGIDIAFPEPGRYRNVYTGRSVEARGTAPAGDVFGRFPAALLTLEQ
ncbi:MAG TPA: malto-oligosyltrehalose synthase [Gammaproteobacteria bacterium]